MNESEIKALGNKKTRNSDLYVTPEVAGFVEASELIDADGVDYIMSHALQVNGRVKLEDYFTESDMILARWAPAESMQSVLTSYHRDLLRHIAKSGQLRFPGVKVDGYQILDYLGSAGQVRTYHAVDVSSTSQSRQTKFVSIKTAKKGDEYLLERERKVLKALEQSNVPHVPLIIGYGRTHNRPYLVTSHSPGIDLREYLKTYGPIPHKYVISCMQQLIETLKQAHEHGVLHRDLKPSNVIYQRGAKPKITLIDWRCGSIEDVRMPGASPLVQLSNLNDSDADRYQLEWLSPEHFESSSFVDAPTDIYATGCLLYYMLTGEAPYSGTAKEIAEQHEAESPPEISSRRERMTRVMQLIPYQLDLLAKQMMTISAKERPDLDLCLALLDDAVARPDIREHAVQNVEIVQSSLTPDTDAQQDTVNLADVAAIETDVSPERATEIDRAAPFPKLEAPDLVNIDNLAYGMMNQITLGIQQWPDLTTSEDQFIETLEYQHRQFASEKNVLAARNLQMYAFEKEKVDNLEGAFDQWKETLIIAPWDVHVRKYYMARLRIRIPRPKSIETSYARASRTLRAGNVVEVIKDAEDALRLNPWAPKPLWQLAMAFELLGYWHSCNAVMEQLFACYSKMTPKLIPMLAVAAKVGVKAHCLRRPRVMLLTIRSLDPEFATTTGFMDVERFVETEIITMSRQADDFQLQ